MGIIRFEPGAVGSPGESSILLPSANIASVADTVIAAARRAEESGSTPLGCAISFTCRLMAGRWDLTPEMFVRPEPCEPTLDK